MSGRRKIDMSRYSRTSAICPHCGAVEWRGEMNSSVESTRHPDGTMTTVRRRVCQCGQHAFRTEEVIVPEGSRLKIVPADEETEEERACA